MTAVWVLIGVDAVSVSVCGYWMRGLWRWHRNLGRWSRALERLHDELVLREEGR
jgi:hypothetical protein